MGVPVNRPVAAGTPEIGYLSRYICRVAISKSRFIAAGMAADHLRASTFVLLRTRDCIKARSRLVIWST
jgi:hypothetical protein